MPLSLPIPLDPDIKAAHNVEGADLNFKKYLLLVQLVRNSTKALLPVTKDVAPSTETIATSQATPTAT